MGGGGHIYKKKLASVLFITGERFNTFRPVLPIEQSLLALRSCKSTVPASFCETADFDASFKKKKN